MDYSKLSSIYQELENTSKGLEKTSIIANFLEEIKDTPDFIYLLQGRVFPDYETKELGISEQLAIRAISKTAGIKDKYVIEEFKKLGDLGFVAEQILTNKKQQTALFQKKLNIEKVLFNIRRIPEFEGKGTVEQKINLIIELLHSATPKESKYIIRTILGDLKVGVGNGLIRDAIVQYCFKPKDINDKKVCAGAVQEAYDKSTDFAEVFTHALENNLEKIKLKPGKPLKVMLFPKAKNVEDAFRIIGKPAAFEYKYDGFRVMINKDEEGKIKIFTRRLEEVTTQFPEIIEYVNEFVDAKTFIIDGEAVGYDFKTKEYTPFQAISQRIKRKYGIEELKKSLPIELELFDIVYLNGTSLIESPFIERRHALEKIIKESPYKIVLAKQIITEDESKVEEFYKRALEEKQEGLMGKSLSAPYKPGARVGYAVKLKPEDQEFDLVITGAEWGTGKRAGWLTSFDVSCRADEELLEVGKVSTGLKEVEKEESKKEEHSFDLTYEEMTNLIEKIVIESDGRKVKLKPEIIVTVQYQNIQKSPTYSSGYALRFPRITRLRTDRNSSDIATIEEIEEAANN